MKRRWLAVLTIALLLTNAFSMTAPSVAAETRTSPENPLLEFEGLVTTCERSDPMSRAACGAYITGFVEGSSAAQDAAVARRIAEGVVAGTISPLDSAMEAAWTKLRDELRSYCIQSHWTASYVAAVAVQYAREHPEARTEMTADHMIKVLEKAFPCGEPE